MMSETGNITFESASFSISDDIKRYRRWFMVLGLIMIALGTAAIIFPFVATMAVEILVGWIFVISGILAFILATLIMIQWPTSATWFIGMLVGIDLIFPAGYFSPCR